MVGVSKREECSGTTNRVFDASCIDLLRSCAPILHPPPPNPTFFLSLSALLSATLAVIDTYDQGCKGKKLTKFDVHGAGTSVLTINSLTIKPSCAQSYSFGQTIRTGNCYAITELTAETMRPTSPNKSVDVRNVHRTVTGRGFGACGLKLFDLPLEDNNILVTI